ncbi:TetR family transcriptional regulator [Gordonia sp. (in: high G+C Gram-positive bacteria)]|uniref:TetR family transcriptional regulator n=1 Tax=Gordonia sp. (in: high G+C Gram-positive bacteria) TaxID=84139 RepID=UPI003C77ED0F
MPEPTDSPEPTDANVAPPDQASKSERTRRRLLDGAMAAFSELGFHGTSTRNIATAAGMSPSAVYMHYKSKEELLYRISKLGHETILGAVSEAAASSTEPAEQLRAATAEFARYHAQEHVTARVVNYEFAALEPEHRDEIVALREAIDSVFNQILAAGIANKTFHTPHARMAAVAIIGSGIDIARWFRDDGTWTAAQVGEFYGDAALRVVGVSN